MPEPKNLNIFRKSLKRPVVIKKPENIFYLTGQKFIYGLLLVSPKQAVFFGDGLEHVEKLKTDSLINIKKYIRPGSILEVEDELTLKEAKFIESKVSKVKLIHRSEILAELRLIKSVEELKLVEKAVKLTHEVFENVKVALKQDTWTEKQLARFIRHEGIGAGAEDVSFDPIVAAGENSAIPHHKPGDRQLKVGEPIVLDFGFKIDGYCSDFTRTVFLRKVSKEFENYYKHVLNAYEAAYSKLKLGMKGKEVDALAREELRKEKLDKFFVHSLGHGTGLEVHESPGVGPYSEGPILDGMVFSIEPGIYLKKKGGIRIEDLVFMDKGKVKQFAECSRQLKDNIL